MRIALRNAAVLLALFICVAANAEQADIPKLLYIDAHRLQDLRTQYKQGDEAAARAVNEAVKKADAALKTPLLSVTEKESTADSGDKHDYVSMAPYFWPDPAKPDGKPYLRKDGQRNPEIKKFTDKGKMGRMTEAVKDLALGYDLSGNEAYAEHAAKLLRTWFLDEPTRMNPNLNYAQFVPGVSTGRGTGLIDTVGFVTIVDAVTLLDHYPKWSAADRAGLRQWFGKFLEWMQTSKNGKDEGSAKNNHGSWYDVQIVTLALFLGNDALAREVAESAKEKRIAAQFEPDGKQPLEMTRTNSWGYSIFNLRALTTLARLAENAGVDLWKFATPDGRSLHQGIDYMLPFAEGKEVWKGSQIGGFKPTDLVPVLKAAATKYNDPKYAEALKKLSKDDPSPLDSALQR